MPTVSSSMINRVDYEEGSKILLVTFRSGATHAYLDVPENEYEALLSSASPGKHFLANIRDQYESRQT